MFHRTHKQQLVCFIVCFFNMLAVSFLDCLLFSRKKTKKKMQTRTLDLKSSIMGAEDYDALLQVKPLQFRSGVYQAYVNRMALQNRELCSAAFCIRVFFSVVLKWRF
ncbi:hypothetical protein BY458DRAFT_264048 [Sporodiniella umbellata]|nr:hypothetical protein BY458DRAFT_264048 [Sporodiniella umbellata]